MSASSRYTPQKYPQATELYELLYHAYLEQNPEATKKNTWVNSPENSTQVLQQYYQSRTQPPIGELIQKFMSGGDKDGSVIEGLRKRIENNLKDDQAELKATYNRLKEKSNRSTEETLFLGVYNFAKGFPNQFRAPYELNDIRGGLPYPADGGYHSQQKSEANHDELINKHKVLALKYLGEASPDPRASYYLGAIAAERNEPGVAINHFAEAANSGNAAAEISLSKYLFDGSRVPTDIKDKFSEELVPDLIMDSAQQNNVEALRYLADHFFYRSVASYNKNGPSSADYSNVAISIYEKLAKQGDDEALGQLASTIHTTIMKGEVSPKDAQRLYQDCAVYLLAYACEAGKNKALDMMLDSVKFVNRFNSFNPEGLTVLLAKAEKVFQAQLDEMKEGGADSDMLSQMNKVMEAYKAYQANINDSRSEKQAMQEALGQLVNKLSELKPQEDSYLSKVIQGLKTIAENYHQLSDPGMEGVVKGSSEHEEYLEKAYSQYTEEDFMRVDLSGVEDIEPEFNAESYMESYGSNEEASEAKMESERESDNEANESLSDEEESTYQEAKEYEGEGDQANVSSSSMFARRPESPALNADIERNLSMVNEGLSKLRDLAEAFPDKAAMIQSKVEKVLDKLPPPDLHR